MESKTQITLRSKTLGALIQDARQASRLSMSECAAAIGVSSGIYRSYESGKRAPSLPELEALSMFFNLPISHFWGTEAISDTPSPIEEIDLARLVGIRQRMIGALMRQERREAGYSMKALAKEAELPPSRIKAYELGERSIPLPELEIMLSILGSGVEKFLDKNGPIGQWMMRQNAIVDFLELPLELQEFVRQPINRPYLELALTLSDFSAEKLRSVAEGILDITF
ncbi:MAG: helix-turn-helix transcriptional regulator [Anaerolineae bacterium]|nr:helix-turn-helix transcriptional regulator [Anaerolineae bacterium]MBT7073963.1 helix-turn-helix transcriptional regulator [Anaerolineae bacterium]MBT7782980.1 helix-turn-helix transcriptional regulator [Anaerolineae bacterium]